MRFHTFLQASFLKQPQLKTRQLSCAWLEEAGGCRRAPGLVMLALGRGMAVLSAWQHQALPAGCVTHRSSWRARAGTAQWDGLFTKENTFQEFLTQLGIRCLFSTFPGNNQDRKRRTQGLNHLAS